MSQENVERVRQAVDAFNRRDRDAFLALCDPDIENVPPREWPESDAIQSGEAIWEFFVEGDEAWEHGPFECVELIDAGNDKILADVRREVRGKASGAATPWRFWQVATFRHGRVLRSEWFVDLAEALEAVGLRE